MGCKLFDAITTLLTLTLIQSQLNGGNEFFIFYKPSLGPNLLQKGGFGCVFKIGEGIDKAYTINSDF